MRGLEAPLFFSRNISVILSNLRVFLHWWRLCSHRTLLFPLLSWARVCVFSCLLRIGNGGMETGNVEGAKLAG